MVFIILSQKSDQGQFKGLDRTYFVVIISVLMRIMTSSGGGIPYMTQNIPGVFFMYYVHDLSPIIFSLGPLGIRWYSLMYVLGFTFSYFVIRYMARRNQIKLEDRDIDNLIVASMLGVLLGARLFYVLFYNPRVYFANPIEILQYWKGGLSFHGGLVGVIVGGYLFAKKKKIRFFHLTDIMTIPVPLGLGFGRLGNFINGELYGRVTDVPWAVVFPGARDGQPRHPSQIYQSFLEGFCLFAILWFLKEKRLKDGTLGCVFLGGYGIFRFIVEYFRQPDAQLGFVFFKLSMGQIFCFLMILAAVIMYGLLPKVYSRNNGESGEQLATEEVSG